jgi:hypothetical protein
MANNQASLYLIIILLSIALVSATAMAYTYYNKPAEVINNTIYAQDNKPLMLYFMSSWGPLEGEPTKTTFNGYVYNYGFTEAKNVSIVCHVSQDKAIIKTFEFFVGNVGSTSYRYTDFDEVYVSPDTAKANCRIKDSPDYVNIDGRIPVEY